jgi:hypothetical protein
VIILIRKYEPKYEQGKLAVIGFSVQPTSVVLPNGLKEDTYGWTTTTGN